MKKMQPRYWAAVAILVVGGGWYWYAHRQSGTGAVQYATEPAAVGTLVSSVTGTGNVAVDQIANVDPTISGTVAGLSVTVGDSVKKGQVLFTIVNDQLGVSVAQAAASLQSAEQSLISAQASRKSARSNLDQATRGSHKSSSSQIATLEKQLEAAQAGELSATRSLASARLNYQYQVSNASERTVKSPIDGTVQEVNVKNGDDLSRISSGNSAVAPVIIGDLATLKAEVSVNEVDIPDVSIGQKVSMTFPAIEGLTLSGKVEQINSLGSVDQGVVTYDVLIGFDMVDSRIRPGMSVSAAIITKVDQDVLLVPAGAVKTQDGVQTVQVLDAGATTPRTVTVETGDTNNTQTVIMDGLRAGDDVVTRTVNPNASAATGASGTGGGLRFPGLGGRG